MLQTWIMQQVTAVNNAGIYYIGLDLWSWLLAIAFYLGAAALFAV